MIRESALLTVDSLKIGLKRKGSILPAVEDLSFEIRRGETLAVVGESGCGKSISMLSLLGLLPQRDWDVRGSARFENRNLIGLPDKDLQRIRGSRIGFIFQDATAAFNPVLPVGYQIAEVLTSHSSLSVAAAEKRAVELLDRVHVPEPDRRARDYPHQLSGGQRQRAMIAMALACDPVLLIADEPTTALDVTVQAQILHLLLSLQKEREMALVLITHDLGVVANMADRVLVMYAGRKIEEQPVGDLIEAPVHPYTKALLAARPHLSGGAGRHQRLNVIPGAVPPLGEWPQGCTFAPRCAFAMDRCRAERPVETVAGGLKVACHLAQYPQHEIILQEVANA
ncbi:hypothetical protein BB934_44850 (plasmid) [Microvirga ossetica]|uniref:ABC transporter domain-containing protein n=1 Tax=Microvirga ossetica TaxID=1882682 RepID=A0A1B2EZA9_9HYPH|nr:ABC transporter ATP-binding protein [Microvirga ossetica]ANY85296.1 hypothetical protein BB934_44850 [Microvirga ossetica]